MIPLAILAVLGVGALAWSRSATSPVQNPAPTIDPPHPVPATVDTQSEPAPAVDTGTPDAGSIVGNEWDNADMIPSIPLTPTDTTPAIQYPVSNGPDNLAAVLATIRQGESNGDYSVCVGGTHFSDFSDHPYNTGQFRGIRRADGRLSTAAGAYQITVSTWSWLGGKKIYGDFSPAAQDRFAVDLIRKKGAYEYALNGDIPALHQALAGTWEFFTQSKWNVENVASVYKDNGGSIA